MAGAAIFDLDRTLLQGGTGPMLSAAMADLGLVPRKRPGEGLLYGIFDLVGETLPSMFLTRQAPLIAKGKASNAFDPAAANAAETIAAQVHPFARTLIEQHRASGRTLVLATTTPFHLIKPLADSLGFDHVIATRYGINDDGLFDGSVDGRFIWSRGKIAEVRDWAERAGIDLAESFAYSDSIYDLPLLSAVGNPSAVNPDPRLTAYALVRGWPIVHFDVSPGVVKVPVVGVELQKMLFAASNPALIPYARFDVAGTENIPSDGPAILVGNHRSYADVLAMIQMMRPTGRTGRILAKQELFDLPVVGPLATALGGIAVDRTTGGQDSFESAALALEGGEIVCVLPQGTIPRGEKFYDPVLIGKSGAARLAAMTRAPVIPFGVWGSEQVWPRSSPVPRMLNVLDPPTIRVRVGPPVELKYAKASTDTRRIMAAIMDLLPPESRERRDLSEDDIARATPGRKPQLF